MAQLVINSTVDSKVIASEDYVDDAIAAISETSPVLSGTIQMYAGATPPSGYLFCDGAAVSRATYSVLFAILSTTYGAGDTTTTFNVPDLRGRIPIGVGTGIGGGGTGTGLPASGSALTAVARAGWKGAETVTADLAAHTHTVYGSLVPQGTGTNVRQLTDVGSGDNNELTSSTGAAGGHANIQPVMGVNFIIKT